MSADTSRRTVLLAAASLASMSGRLAAAGETAPTRRAHARTRTPAADPRASAEGQIKLNATLDGSPAYWCYSGTLYAVRPHVRPLPILGVSGCQANWARRRADGAYEMAAPLLSYFLDVGTREFLDEFDNPVTKRRNAVRANFFPGSARALFPADGSALQIEGSLRASASAPNGFAPPPHEGIGRVEWQLTRDTVVLSTEHFFAVKTQPQCEAQTRTGDRALFFDPRVRRMPARYTATTVSPWLDWMEMGAEDGHLVWHTTGDKRFSVDELPLPYRQRAGAALEQLSTAPSA